MTETTITTLVNTEKNNAVQFVNSHSMAEIIDHLAEQYQALKSSREANRIVRYRLQTFNAVTDFIKDHYKDGATCSEIVELAAELDIELEKQLTVTFTADVKVTLDVPFDFDEEDISEDMFPVSVDFKLNNDDIELNNDNIEISDFYVETN